MSKFPFSTIKKFKVKRPGKEIEPHEVFWDSLAQKKEEELGISEKKIEVPFSKTLALIVYVIFFIIIIIFLGRVLQLQIIKGEELSLRASENAERIYQIRAKRGVIYDSEQRQLVWNKPSFDLVLDKRDFPKEEEERRKILQEISLFFEEITVEDLLQTIEKSGTIILLYENLNHADLLALELKIKNQNEFPGVKIKENAVRYYIEGISFSHLMGYTGKINPDELKIFSAYSLTDHIGKTGLEKSYEEILRGEPGEFQVEKNARGETLAEFVKTQPKTGQSLVLWLDSELQKKIESELKKKFKEINANKAAVVAINPKTGGVLALVSLPDFDNNQMSGGISSEELKAIQDDPLKPFVHRAIAGEYLTGSTIKPFIAAAALEEKIISPDKKIYCAGEIAVENPWFNPDETELGQKEWVYHDWMVHGWTNLKKAIAESCNIYFYTIGGGYKDFKGLGEKKIKQYLELFGWGSKTRVDLPNEQKGFVPDAQWKKEVIGADWTIGNTYHFSIGQGYVKATPIQVAVAFSAIANKGILYQPQLVQRILDPSAGSSAEAHSKPSGQDKKIEPKIVRKDFINPENLQIIRQGMREAVIYGSGVVLQDLPVKAAAKTGTAQTPKKDYYHNWVTVFAPFDDPQIVLTIVIEDVKGLQSATLPVAKETLKWYFSEQRIENREQ